MRKEKTSSAIFHFDKRRTLRYTGENGGVVMTAKELMYVEDALESEKQLRAQCKAASSGFQDGELKDFAKQLEQKHQDIFNSFYSLL